MDTVDSGESHNVLGEIAHGLDVEVGVINVDVAGIVVTNTRAVAEVAATPLIGSQANGSAARNAAVGGRSVGAAISNTNLSACKGVF